MEVGLKVDGKVIEDLTLTLSEDNSWTDAFENINPEMGTAFEVYSITEDFDSSKEQEGYLYECAGSVEEGFTVHAVRSVVLNTEARWIDNDNASGKRPDTVSLIFKGGSQEEIVNVTSSHVLPDTVEADLVVPKYQEDGTLYTYTVSGGTYSDTEWLIDTANEDGVYIVNYRLEDEEPGVDKDKLFDLLEQYGGYRSSDYTTETWEPFKAAYDAAKAVYLDESATQEEVDAATAELTRTGKALVKASEPTVPSDGNEETTEKPPVTAVKTGDTGNMAVLWAMLLAVSAGTYIYVKKRKTQ